MRKLPALVSAALMALLPAACSSGSGATKIAVSASDSSCGISKAAVGPGKLHVDVHNGGTKVTEVYVYAPGDRPLGEVEHIAAGDDASFTVDIGGGDYEVACKPGEAGDGIRSALHVTGPAASSASEDASAASDRATYRGRDTFSVLIEAFDTHIAASDDLVVVKGQTVIFQLQNSATSAAHQLQILGPDGTVLGKLGPTAPKASGTLTLTFTTLGTYRYIDPSATPDVEGASGTFDVID